MLSSHTTATGAHAIAQLSEAAAVPVNARCWGRLPCHLTIPFAVYEHCLDTRECTIIALCAEVELLQ